MNFDKICIFHKHLRSSFGAERKFFKKKFTEANFSNLVSYLLYAYKKKSTENLSAKSIFWAKLDMRILRRLALKFSVLLPYKEVTPVIIFLRGIFFASSSDFLRKSPLF